MRILIIGAGAVGGYFGARLQQHGRDVTFLVRPQRAMRLQREGLCIGGPLGDFAVQPRTLTTEGLAATPQTFDLILLGVKAYSLLPAMEDFAPAVGPHTAILPLLNGLGHLDTLRDRFGREAVLGGTTRIVAYLEADGRIVLLETLHDVTFGELNRQDTLRIRVIKETLSGCGFDAELSPDILAAMWFKWVFLASVGSITLLGRGTVGEINQAPGGRDLALAVAAEAAAVGAANGYALSPDAMGIIHARLTRTDSMLVSSMYRDLHKGAAVEADHILGDLLRRGRACGVETPLLRAAYTQTKVYEARRAS